MFSLLKSAKRALLHYRHQHFVARIMHDEVLNYVHEEGRVSARYVFMVLMSCGIAMLGLLMSSTAVVIGAMLISPLMGPIMSLGFSLCVLDIQELKRSLKGVVVGLIMAIVVSWVIVTFSPLNEPTSEILARTKPNLFDLLVAVFSGLAGGYAVIRRKGETIVGVAIATALMPPLAVGGYGIAVGDADIWQGALFLFMTNLLAISLCVTLLAKWYGFGGYGRSKHTVVQSVLILAVFALLSLPLGLSLKKISYEVYATKIIRANLSKFLDSKAARLNGFNIAFDHESEDITVEAVVLTRKYMNEAEDVLQRSWKDKLETKVNLVLGQVVMANAAEFAEQAEKKFSSNNAISAPISQVPMVHMAPKLGIMNDVQSLLGKGFGLISVNEENKQLSVAVNVSERRSLRTLFDAEEDLKEAFPEWKVDVIPPAQALPPIYFDVGITESKEQYLSRYRHVVWALKKWNVKNVSAVGFASTFGGERRNQGLALKRAQYIADLLKADGIEATARKDFVTDGQREEEIRKGTDSFQKVEIRLIPAEEELPLLVESAEAVEVTQGEDSMSESAVSIPPAIAE